jgi:histidinol phosphatase-like PHP family hydrolase
MIDLHTHTLLSDGELLPAELATRAENIGYKAIAFTDHVDSSNLDIVLPQIIKACNHLDKFFSIKIIPGVELTHIPPSAIKDMVKDARKMGAKIIIVHGETIVEPVKPGTNKAALEVDIDILAHPGLITREEVRLARNKGIYLELTTRSGHCYTNGHIVKLARKEAAKLIINNDSHSIDDLFSPALVKKIILGAGVTEEELESMIYKRNKLYFRI